MKRLKMLQVLEAIKYFILFVLVLMFINFNTQIVKQTENTNKLAESTNQVVKGQGDILKAIKQVTEDTRITANQQTAIIICMLQVPIDARSTDLQAECRKQADVVQDNIVYKDNTVVPQSSSNSTPTTQQKQSNNSQTTTPTNTTSPSKLCVPLVLVKLGCR